jgi:hypothetical protein
MTRSTDDLSPSPGRIGELSQHGQGSRREALGGKSGVTGA